MDRAELLLEIGSEEIPAGYLPPAARAMRRRLLGLLDENGLDYDTDGVTVYATPRRLAVVVPGLATSQPTRVELKLGPAVGASFDPDGKPTKAAKGFARSVGATVEELGRFPGGKGERLGLEVEAGGCSTAGVLLAPRVMRGLIQLGFPKTMRWVPGDDLAYARPIRWLVCLLGAEVIPVELGELRADRISRGHRTLAPGPVELGEASEYVGALANAGVVVDPELRRGHIQAEAERLSLEAGGSLHPDPGLLDEVVYLVEHPTGLSGRFDPELTETLPREVIITAMRSHQRYFSVEREDGSLVPCFITFRDGGEEGMANVVQGNERVLRARLDDALFYWNEDRALSSEAKVERLDHIVWLEGLGSVGDKCRRIADLASWLADSLGLGVDASQLTRSGVLCKSDLATEMIKDGKEFTKLQGIMGRYYALEAGEPVDVADAIEEHLRPRSAQDDLPPGLLGTLVGLADRLDSMAGCVLAGFAPTGSQDPYGLRRQALAVLRILVDRGWHCDLGAWIDRALASHPGGEEEKAAANATITGIFWARLESLLGELPPEIVRAVLSVFPLDPLENVRAARDLAALEGAESFGMLLEGAKRCRNILVKAGRLPEEGDDAQLRAGRLQRLARERWDEASVSTVDPVAFAEDAERVLVRESQAALPILAEGLEEGDYKRVYTRLADLGPHIDRYFTEVLVNAEDETVRRQRLDWLETLHYLFARFADLSRVPTVQGRTGGG